MIFLARKSKEEKIEACYNLFQEVNWDLLRFNNNTDLFVDEVRKNAREYAETILKESLTKEQIWCLLPTSIRLLFNDYNTILKLMLKENVISRQQLTDINWIIDNLKLNISKFCYDVAEEYKWINVDIDEYCKKHGILPKSLKNLAREYTLEVLKWDEQQREEHWNKKLSYRKDYNLNQAKDNSIGIFAKMFVQLSEIDENEEVIQFLSATGKEYYAIRNELFKFISSYNVSDSVRDDLINKIKIYQDYLANNRRIEQEKKKEEKQVNYIKENLDIARLIINQYICGQYENTDKYCNSIDLDRKLFDKYLDLVKNNDEQLYNKYLKHLENNKNKVYEDLLSRTLTVIDLMKHGVIENGVRRDFDLIDYYRYLPLGFDRMLRIVRDGISQEDYKLLSTYVGKNKNERELSEFEINNLYNMKTIVDVQFDEENKVIPGSGREITKEEKENIINYLKSNNIPVTNKTYNIIYRRWLSGNLIIEKEKDKTK